jgi:hypothetical protein
LDAFEAGSITKSLFSHFLSLTDLMKLFEFLLATYSEGFFDNQSVNYSRFNNFMKNLSARILEPTYFNQMIQILQKSKKPDSEKNEFILKISCSIIGIFLQLDNAKNHPKFEDFITSLFIKSHLDIDPFLNLLSFAKPLLEKDNKLNNGLEKTQEILLSLLSKQKTYLEMVKFILIIY